MVGNSGSGKSRLARRLASTLGVPYVELDSIHHLPGWREIDSAEFAAEVDAITGTDGWVIDGNYRAVVVDGPVWARAETVVWLDLPRRTVMRQVVGRTVRRAVTHEELWNGNREPLRNLWSRDPERSVVRWSWTQHAKYVARYTDAMTSPRFEHIDFVRLRSHADGDRLIQRIGAASGCDPGPISRP